MKRTLIPRSILGTCIGNDDFIRQTRLRRHRTEKTLQAGPVVENGGDERDHKRVKINTLIANLSKKRPHFLRKI